MDQSQVGKQLLGIGARTAPASARRKPAFRRLRHNLILSGASGYWTRNHSHSMVAGGLPEMS